MSDRSYICCICILYLVEPHFPLNFDRIFAPMNEDEKGNGRSNLMMKKHI